MSRRKALPSSRALGARGKHLSRGGPHRAAERGRSGSFRKNRYPYGWYPPHPSFFATKEIYDKFGVFDIELTIASDVDLMLRLLSSTEKKVAYLPKIISKVRLGGVSNRSIINILKLNIEIWTSLKKYQLHKSILHYVFGKASSRVSQFLKIGYKP